MLLEMSEENKRLYSKLFVSAEDIQFAQFCCGMLIKKKWHWNPWERRWTTIQQQAAYTTALIASYVRPFTQSRGWPTFPEGLLQSSYDIDDMALHTSLKELRHQIYAHSQADRFEIRPWKARGFETDIVTSPARRISAEEASRFMEMTPTLLAAMTNRMKELRATAETPMASSQ